MQTQTSPNVIPYIVGAGLGFLMAYFFLYVPEQDKSKQASVTISSQRDRLDDLNEELDKKKQELIDQQAEDTNSADLDRLRDQIGEKNTRINDLNARIKELMGENARFDGSEEEWQQKLDEQAEEMRDTIARMREEYQLMVAKKDSLDRAKDVVIDDLRATNKQLNQRILEMEGNFTKISELLRKAMSLEVQADLMGGGLFKKHTDEKYELYMQASRIYQTLYASPYNLKEAKAYRKNISEKVTAMGKDATLLPPMEGE
jgi:chromosome segregation ATPase